MSEGQILPCAKSFSTPKTTGLDPLRGDRLVEIGCVEIVNRFVTGQVFHRYINPERPMSPEAFAVHGLSDAFLSDKPVFRQIADEFLAFIGDDPLIIHNASFDMGFLNAELKRLKKGPLAADRVVDTLAIARASIPGSRIRSTHSVGAMASITAGARDTARCSMRKSSRRSMPSLPAASNRACFSALHPRATAATRWMSRAGRSSAPSWPPFT